jgi:hypothetical protein
MFMPPPERHSYRGSILRGYVAEVRRMGIFDELRARSSPALELLLNDPHGFPHWVESGPLHELISTVGELRGREGVRQLGYGTTKHGGFTSVLEPIIHLSLRMLGGGPSSLLSRSQLMASVISRGVEMKWVPTSPTSGTMKMRCEAPMNDLSWAVWEGSILYGVELAGAMGTVEPARRGDDGKSCEIDVRWDGAR